MKHYFCKCLNVKIYAESITENIFKDLTFQKDLPEKFFEVNLASEAICYANQFLVDKFKVDDWEVHQCVQCCLVTHAIKTHADNLNHTYIINESLLQDEKEIELLKSSNYSELYKIVLQESSPIQIKSYKDEKSVKVVEDLTQQYEEYVSNEQKKVDEKIKLFIEQQNAAFESKKTLLLKQKDQLISTILSNSQQRLIFRENKPCSSSKVPEGNDDITNIKENYSNHEDNEFGSATNQQNTSAKPLQKPATSEDLFEELPDDIMFDQALEEEDVKNDVEYENEHEEEEDKDELADIPVLNVKGKNVMKSKRVDDYNDLYSTSAPITVPQGARLLSFDKFDKNPPKDPEAMRANIMEMARSCRPTDTVDIFGDLPMTIMQKQKFEVYSRMGEMPGVGSNL